MRYRLSLINIIFMIIISRCSLEKQQEIIAKYSGGELTKKELIDRIGIKKINKASKSKNYLIKVQESAYKQILFDHYNDLLDDKEVKNELKRIENDKKIKLVIDFLVDNYVVNDSIKRFIYSSQLTQYTIQEITITHRLSYARQKNRSPKEAYDIGKVIRKRIDSNQISFDQAVSVYAEHPVVKLTNGIVGPLTYGKLPSKELSDAIWQSEPGDIIGPLETKLGYNVFQTVKKEVIDTTAALKSKMKNLASDIKKGRYEIIDDYIDEKANTWFRAFGGEIYIDHIDTLWQIADSLELFTISEDNPNPILNLNGIPILNLDKTNYFQPLARIQNKNLSINWFISEAKKHGTYDEKTFQNGYFLHQTIKEILYRNSAIMWFDKNSTKFDHQKTNELIKIKQENYLFDTYINQEMEKDSSLIKSIVLNRLAIKYNLEIH